MLPVRVKALFARARELGTDDWVAGGECSGGFWTLDFESGVAVANCMVEMTVGR